MDITKTKFHSRVLARTGAFEDGGDDLTPIEGPSELPTIDPGTLIAAGLDPACLPAEGHCPTVSGHPATQRQHEAEDRARITDDEWLAVHRLTSKWRTNNVKHRNHRATVDDALWLARKKAPFCSLGQDRDKFDAFRQRCVSWAKIGRWKELLDAATATGVWRSERLRELQIVVEWAERTHSRIWAGRAALHESVRSRGAS